MLLTNDSAGHRHLPPSGGAGPSQWPRPESPPGVTANGARGSGTGSPTVTQNQPRAKLWLRAPGEHHGRGAGQAQLWLGNPAPPLSWSVSANVGSAIFKDAVAPLSWLLCQQKAIHRWRQPTMRATCLWRTAVYLKQAGKNDCRPAQERDCDAVQGLPGHSRTL